MIQKKKNKIKNREVTPFLTHSNARVCDLLDNCLFKLVMLNKFYAIRKTYIGVGKGMY